ncbi:MAG: NACHT domain-containing protein [Candidatus Poseidoniales archaeon]|nr:MAG: NACHT domain-containing protein [Candidatus Poseidoniales archaeon]
MESDIFAKISQSLTQESTLIPRVERFVANNKIVTSGFQSYIGKRILRDLSKSVSGKSLNLMLYGHPSLGKTTELRNIVHLLCGLKEFRNNFSLMFSEFQRAESSAKQTVWENIRTGSLLFDEAPEHETSLENFAHTAHEAGKTPLIVLDTLDILLLDEAAGTANTMQKWNDFLIESSKHGVSIFWTCRPYEWNYFKEKLNPKILKRTMSVELPPLESSHCTPFPKIFESDESHWSNWSTQLQSYMPLFASRWTTQCEEDKKLSSDFFQQLGEHVETVWNNPLGTQTLELPSTLYYHSLWSKIRSNLSNESSMDSQETNRLQMQFEKHIMSLTRRSRSHRLRFSATDFSIFYTGDSKDSIDAIKAKFVMDRSTEIKKSPALLTKYRNELTEEINKLGESSDVDSGNTYAEELKSFIPLRDEHLANRSNKSSDIVAFFDACIRFGLLKRVEDWFEFSHQLLFEETLFTQTSNEISTYQFPSVALRKLPPGSGKDLLRREAEKARVHWTGAILSFHPNIGSAENADWNLWIEEAYKLNLLSDSEENEMNEKNIILRDYMDSESDAALFLRGAPGTGKTYFCLNFIVEHLKTTSKRIRWRYVTLNKPLVDSVVTQWDERARRPQNSGIIGMQDTDSGARSVGDIILAVLRESDDSTLHSIKLLDYSRFKQALDNWFEKKGQGTTPPPSYTDAWADFTTLFHHSSGAVNNTIGDESEYENHELRSVTGTRNQRELFAKFCFYILGSKWKIYPHASYLARKQLTLRRGKSRQQFDMLMIDEVQDITPSTMSLLLLLLRPGFSSKSILVAGDDLQTVNRSGFAWFDFCQKTIEILTWTEERAHSELDRLLSFGISQNIDSDLQTLKQVYRNAPKIAILNDTFRSTFADQYPTEKMPNYPRDFLKISDMAQEKNADCKISIISAPTDKHLRDVISSLSRNAREISITSKTSIITPYESTLEDDLESVGNFTTYNGETVKGLEFSGVVIFNPYEMFYSDAEGNLNKGLNKSSIEERIRTWMKRDSEPSKQSMKNFLKLYQNIMTRMNVLLSRPEFRLLIVTREPFPQTAQPKDALRINTYFDAPESIVFSLPTLPANTVTELDISMLDMNQSNTNLDMFISNALLRVSNVEGYSINNYLRWALDESQIGNFANERQSWKNFLEVKPAELIKSQSAPIPVFSTLLLAGTNTAEPGTFIGNKIRLPTALTAFRKEYSTTSGWGELSDQSPSGTVEIFLTSLSKGIFKGALPIEIYYSLGELLEPFLEYVLQDASMCVEHHPYILHLIGKEILGIHFDEYALKVGEGLTVDENLSFNGKFKPRFTKPSLDDTVERMTGNNVFLDENAHILDRILLHINNQIDHSVFEHILAPSFALSPSSRNQIEKILNAPNQSPFWVEMAHTYPDWNSIVGASSSMSDLLSASLQRQELRHTIQMLWAIDAENTPIKRWPEETSLEFVKDFFFHSNQPHILNHFPNKNHSSLEEFFGDILDVQFVEFGGEDPSLPMSRLFNNGKFWSAIVTYTLGRITSNPPKSLTNDGKSLWSTWYFNIQGNRPPSTSSAFYDYLSLIGRSLSKVQNWNKTKHLAIDLMLFMNFPSQSLVQNYDLMKDLLDEFEQGEILRRSQRAAQMFSVLMGDLIAGPRLTLKAEQRHVDSGQATKLGEIFTTNARDVSYRLDSRFVENRLHFLFQIVLQYTKPNSEKEPILTSDRGFYNRIYQSTNDVAPQIFTELSGRTDEERKRKREFSRHFNRLVEGLANDDNVLMTRIPFTNQERMDEAWSAWLANLLYGALEYEFSLGGDAASVEVEHNRFISPQGGRKVASALKEYFGHHFKKCSPLRFFQVYFSMVNCGEYIPPNDWAPEKNEELQKIGILTGIESHFNINARTAFFIGALTELVDGIESVPEGFLDSRNTNPIRYHPAYRFQKHAGISPKDAEAISSSSRSTKELAADYGLPQNTIQRIRNAVNFVPFYYRSSIESTNEDGTKTVRQLPNQNSGIHQPRMSAFDIAYSPYLPVDGKMAEDPRKKWIIDNLNGLSNAVGGGNSRNRKRILHHICYAMANRYGQKSSPISHSSMKISPGRVLAISILRTPGIVKENRLEDHQLDWRILFEMMKIGSGDTNSFDEFIEALVEEINQTSPKTLDFSTLLLNNVQLDDFFRLLTDPVNYLFKEKKIFTPADFANLPNNFSKDHFFFLERRQVGGGLTPEQKRYTLQIAWGFIRYTMYRAGFDCGEDIDESVPIDQRIFHRRD